MVVAPAARTTLAPSTANGDSRVNGSNWRSQLFASAFVIFFICYGARICYELVLPMLWLACPLSILAILGVGLWLYFRWRNGDWDY
jgi:hypothetical protein